MAQNTTWSPTAAKDYILKGPLDVPTGVTLTIAPGTVVKAENGYGMSVEGSLVAVGTNGSPVTFTSFNDNSVGGSTGTGNPQAGDWPGITVYGNADIENAAVNHASHAIASGTNGASAVVVKNDTFAAPQLAAVDVSAEAVTVKNSTVTGMPAPGSPGNPDECAYDLQ